MQHTAGTGKKNAWRIFMGKPQEKGPLGRSGHRWEDNIQMYLREREEDGVVWTGFVCLRVGGSGGLL
jgi:hypothetical protein